MLTVHGVHRSRATRTFWLAGELGIEAAQVPVIQAYRLPDPHAPGAPPHTLSPDFLALSPAGAIPVIEDDGFVLSESLAINLYLAKKHGGPLAPADLHEDALMMQWALYGATAIEPPALGILYAVTENREDDVPAFVEKLHRPLKVLDAHLATQGHMVGHRFTVADINMAEIVRYATGAKGLIEGYPAIAAWLAACQSRPAYKAMWEKRLAEPA